MKKLLQLGALSTLIGFAGLSFAASTASVNIQNYHFSPAILIVSPGTTVTWTNNDNEPHTVTADNDSWDSGNIPPGSTYSKTFSKLGAYLYTCDAEPYMKGKVIVQNQNSGS